MGGRNKHAKALMEIKGIRYTEALQELRELPPEADWKAYVERCQALALAVDPDRPRSFPVTDPDLDAPDGAVVDGYERVGDTWYKRT